MASGCLEANAVYLTGGTHDGRVGPAQKDGSFGQARFDAPFGLCAVGDALLVCDSTGKTVREVDLKTRNDTHDPSPRLRPQCLRALRAPLTILLSAPVPLLSFRDGVDTVVELAAAGAPRVLPRRV